MSGLGAMTPLRGLCAKHGTDRTSLARKAGMSRQTLYDIEAGKGYTLDTLHKIAATLGETPDYVQAVLEGKVQFFNEIREVAA